MRVPGLMMHGKERVAMLVYPGFTALDLVGPHYFLACMMGATVQLVARTLEPMHSDLKLAVMPDVGRAERSLQLSLLLEGYEQLRPFNRHELTLIEPLRTLRIIHYSAWLARRWQDPIFPANFPWFGSSDYWQGQVRALEEQIEAMAEPELVV